MSVNKILLVAAVLGLGGCGPEAADDWMLGVYSNYDVLGSAAPTRITHYEVMEDHSVAVRQGLNCAGGANEVVAAWESRGDDLFVITAPEPEDVPEGKMPWTLSDKYVRRIKICGDSGTERFGVGFTPEQTDVARLIRGKMCSRLSTVPGAINSCEYFWCDEPPPCPYD
jgi:hypothetical protein